MQLRGTLGASFVPPTSPTGNPKRPVVPLARGLGAALTGECCLKNFAGRVAVVPGAPAEPMSPEVSFFRRGGPPLDGREPFPSVLVGAVGGSGAAAKPAEEGGRRSRG